MKYALVLITHGSAPQLDRVLDAFAENVTPAPSALLAFVDGNGRIPPAEQLGQWRTCVSPRQRGFCETTKYAWATAAATEEVDYVFWLEHDFVIQKPIDLAVLSRVLDERRELAQMQLMRNAVSDHEIAAGGLYESRPGQYEPRWSVPLVQSGLTPAWLRHRSYLSTNPCLMLRDFMVENTWPDYADFCEGRFGIDLVNDGYSFGVWGAGEPWVEHVGHRDGTGHGY